MVYNKDVKSTLDEAQQSKSPIKLQNFKRKANFKNNAATDIQISRGTKIQVLEKASFPHCKLSKSISPKLKIKDIKLNSYDRQEVTVIGYIDKKGKLNLHASKLCLILPARQLNK